MKVSQSADLMEDTVYVRSDAIDDGYFGPLLQVEAFVFLQSYIGHVFLLFRLFILVIELLGILFVVVFPLLQWQEELIEFVFLGVSLSPVTEKEEEQETHDHQNDDGADHTVELVDRMP